MVFGYDEKRVIPLFVPKAMRERVVRLFFQKSEDGSESHYCVVKDMSKLVASQVSRKTKKHVCDFCLNTFGNDELLEKHLEYCSKHDAVNVKMPVAGRNTLKFKNIQNMIECSIKIIFDFESFLKRSNAGADPGRGESGSSHGQIFSTLEYFALTSLKILD